MKKLAIAFTVFLGGLFTTANCQNAQSQGAASPVKGSGSSSKLVLPPPHNSSYTLKPRVKPVPHDLHITQPKAVPVKPAPQPVNK